MNMENDLLINKIREEILKFIEEPDQIVLCIFVSCIIGIIVVGLVWYYRSRESELKPYPIQPTNSYTPKHQDYCFHSSRRDDAYVTSIEAHASTLEENVLDLHRYSESRAIEKFEDFLEHHRQLKKHEYLFTITGYGKHSPNNEPVIKPAIFEYLQKNEPSIKINYLHEDANEGCLALYNY